MAKHRLLKFLLGTVVTVGVIAGAAIYFVTDNSMEEVNVRDGIDMEGYVNELILRSMEDTKTTGKVSFKVGEGELNQLLHTVLSEVPEAKDYVNQAYAKINGNKYDFYISAGSMGINTKVGLKTTLSETDDDFVFTINDVTVGKISGTVGIAKSLAGNFVKDSDIEATLAESGLHVHVSISEGKIIYNKDTLWNDLKAVVNSGESDANTDLFFTVLDDVKANHLIDLGFENAISLDIDLNTLKDNPTYTNGNVEKFDIYAMCGKLETLIDSSVIAAETEVLDKYYGFLLNGYEAQEDAFKSELDGKDLTSIGIASASSYEGIGIPSAAGLDEVINSKVGGDWADPITLITSDSAQVSLIDESDMTNYMLSSGMLGTKFLIPGTLDGHNHVHYVAIDRVYTNIYNVDGAGKMDIVIGLDVNGFETSLIFNATFAESTGYYVQFSIDSVYFGGARANDALINYFFDILRENASDGSSLIISGNSVKIDFEDAIRSNTYAAMIMAFGTPSIKVNGEGIDDNGSIELVMTKNF